MSDKDKIKSTTFDSLSIFSTLTPVQQQKIITQSKPIFIKSGETLIKEGDEADSLYFLEQGRLIVFTGEKPIAEILPGESIGEIAFLTKEKRTATVVASRNSKLLQLEQSAYKSLIKDIPVLMGM